MKILFIVDGSFLSDNLKEILEQHPDGINPEFYYLIKALENNQPFEKAILQARKNLEFPQEGLKWKPLGKAEAGFLFEPSGNSMFFGFSEDEASMISKALLLEAKKIQKRFKLHEDIIGQLPNIIAYGCVYPEASSIYLEIVDDKPDFCHIVITRKVNKSELKEYIDQHWGFIERHLKYLPEKPNAYISQRDKRIIELKDNEQLSFRVIADKIVSEFNLDNTAAKINEDSVKIAYNRAKAKIKRTAESIR